MLETVKEFRADVVDWEPRLKELKERNVTGVVFYTDGGQRMVNFKSRSGFGIHGYFYNEDKPKGIGSFKTWYPTAKGYLPKKEVLEGESVNIVQFLNVYGFNGAKTNNVAELEGVIQAMKIFLKTGIKDICNVICIRTDSEYVKKGITDYLSDWKKNNWRKSSGEPVKNVGYWKEIDALMSLIVAAEKTLDISWVKGHEDYGNLIADQMATLGLFQEKDYDDVWIERAEYTASSLEINPLLLDSKLMYFPAITNRCDGYWHHMLYNSNNNQDDAHDVGRNLVDASIAIVATRDEQALLCELYDLCKLLDDEVSVSPKVLDLNIVSKPNIQVELIPDNIVHLERVLDKKDIKIKATNDKTLVTVLDPPRNAYFTSKRLEELAAVYREYESKVNPTIIETDITDLLFDTEVNKKGVTKYKFKVTEAIHVDVEASIWKEAGTKKHDLTLTFGLDLPRRRVFSNLKDCNPKVSVITWYENEHISYFATVVKTDDSFGIWMAEITGTVLTGDLKS